MLVLCSLLLATTTPQTHVDVASGVPDSGTLDESQDMATHEVMFVLTVSGTLDLYTEALMANLKAKMSSQLELDGIAVGVSAMGVTLTPGSVIMTVRIGFTSVSDARACLAALAPRIASVAEASEFLSTASSSLIVESIDTPPTVGSVGFTPPDHTAAAAVQRFSPDTEQQSSGLRLGLALGVAALSVAMVAVGCSASSASKRKRKTAPS